MLEDLTSPKKKSWWEEHPMTYDWNERLDDACLGLDYFSEVDRRMSEGHWFAQEAGRPLFSKLIPYTSLNNKSVLEIGCGLGSIAQEFAIHGARLTAVDLTERAIRLSSKRFRLQELPGHFIQTNAEQLPLKDNSFDYVWSWGVLHHTSGTKQAIREITRVLKPGGIAAVMMYNRYSVRNLVRVILPHGIFGLKLLTHSLIELENRYSDGTIAKHYSPRGIREAFQELRDHRLSIYGQRSEIFPGYHRLPPFLTFPVEPLVRRLLKRFGWFLFLEARKP